MLRKTGDIWSYHAEGCWIVITTNIGWRNDGRNPMGAGIAAQAATFFPDLPLWYGHRCLKYGKDTAVCPYPDAKFILFPTKPLNIENPWLSWQADSDLVLIERSAIQLQKLGEILRNVNENIGPIALPMVGCQNGRLLPEVVRPILARRLDDSFILVERP